MNSSRRKLLSSFVKYSPLAAVGGAALGVVSHPAVARAGQRPFTIPGNRATVRPLLFDGDPEFGGDGPVFSLAIALFTDGCLLKADVVVRAVESDRRDRSRSADRSAAMSGCVHVVGAAPCPIVAIRSQRLATHAYVDRNHALDVFDDPDAEFAALYKVAPMLRRLAYVGDLKGKDVATIGEDPNVIRTQVTIDFHDIEVVL